MADGSGGAGQERGYLFRCDGQADDARALRINSLLSRRQDCMRLRPGRELGYFAGSLLEQAYRFCPAKG